MQQLSGPDPTTIMLDQFARLAILEFFQAAVWALVFGVVLTIVIKITTRD